MTFFGLAYFAGSSVKGSHSSMNPCSALRSGAWAVREDRHARFAISRLYDILKKRIAALQWCRPRLCGVGSADEFHPPPKYSISRTLAVMRRVRIFKAAVSSVKSVVCAAITFR